MGTSKFIQHYKRHSARDDNNGNDTYSGGSRNLRTGARGIIFRSEDCFDVLHTYPMLLYWE